MKTDMDVRPKKPLGAKAYGHIPHLPTSRRRPGDHCIHEGQARIATERTRDTHDLVIVTEKLDGSCVSAAKIDGQIVPLNRAGYPAGSSKWECHRMFSDWVYANYDRFDAVLSNGERLVGEWLAQAHGTRYDLQHEPFVVFDLMREGERATDEEVGDRMTGKFTTAPLIATGATSVEFVAKALLAWPPRSGALDPVEGAVWRVERHGKFDFICKWVRSDKVSFILIA